MRKAIKIILSVVSALILTAVVVPVVATIALSSYSVQNWVAGKFTKYFSERLGTTVSVGHIGIKLFNRVTLDEVYVEDFGHDTLLYVDHLDVGLRGYNPATGVIRLGEVRLGGADFRLVQDSTGVTNLAALLAKLKSDKPKKNRPFALRAGSLTVDSTRFRMQKYVIPDREEGINFADLDIRGLSLDFQAVRIDSDSVRADIRRLSATEKSGFRLREFSGKNVAVGSRGIQIAELRLADDDSEVVMPELALAYPGWKAFGDFIRSVEMHAVIRDSRVAMRTIGWFAPSLLAWESAVRLEGIFDGTVADLSGRLDEAAIGDTRLRTRFHIAGLPKIDKTRFDLDVDELSTDAASAAAIFRDIGGKELPPSTAQRLEGLGKVTLAGTFEGLPADFRADARLQAAPGNADFRLQVNPEAEGGIGLKGDVSLADFRLGQLLGVEKLGAATVSARIDGTLGGAAMALTTDAAIERLHFNGYDYHDIRAEGEVRNKYYKGIVASTDPNLDFRLDGTFDFDRPVPEYDFALDIERIDLHALRFNERDSVSVLQADMRIDARGTTLDAITGHGTISGLTYWFPGDSIVSRNISLFGDNLSEQKRIRFDSDFLDAELTSRASVVDLIPAIRQTIRYYLPSLGNGAAQPTDTLPTGGDDYYALQLNIKEAGEFVATALMPGLYIAPGTTLSAVFNPSTRNFSTLVRSDLIQYNNIYVAGLEATNRNQADSIAVYLRTDEVAVGGFYMPGLAVNGGVRDNTVNLSTGFDNPQNGLSVLLNTVSQMQPDSVSGKNGWLTRVLASRIGIGEEQWRIASPGIGWGGDVIAVDRFRIFTEGQEFLLDGRLSAAPTDTLRLAVSDFDLAPLSGLLDRYGYGIAGHMNGRAELIGGRGETPLFYGRLAFNNLIFNGKNIPNSTFVSEWDPVAERVDISLALDSGRPVIEGQYNTQSRRYELRAEVPGLDLALLDPVLEGVLADIEGAADLSLTLTGAGKELDLDGTIAVKSFAGTVDFTRARYHFADAVIRVANNRVTLPRTTIYDQEGGEGELTLSLDIRSLSQLNYAVSVTPRGMLALNTTAADNDNFYGKAYASGTVTIAGNPHAIDMQINAATEANSTFFMPLSGVSSIAEADFIVFENPNAENEAATLSRYELMKRMREQAGKNPARKSTMNIDLNIDVHPNTRVELVIDPQNGGTIQANGTGTLSLHLEPAEDVFTMFGDYRINQGDYQLTLMTVMDKRFTIEPGSSIRWVGDPLNAMLDVTASYHVRASTAPITGEAEGRMVPVDCQIILSDRLSQPVITFDIALPSADAELRGELQTAMNTQEQKSQQFVWLVMTGEFYGGSTANIGTATTAASTGIEFLTNQLSNWLSTERFNFNLGYTLGNNQMATSDEVEGAFSGELISDKLLFEGEVNYNLGTNTADPRNNQFSGDFYLTYIINRRGSLRARIFSRTIDRYDENQGLQEQGGGIYYTQDFDRWSELFRRNRAKKTTE